MPIERWFCIGGSFAHQLGQLVLQFEPAQLEATGCGIWIDLEFDFFVLRRCRLVVMELGEAAKK